MAMDNALVGKMRSMREAATGKLQILSSQQQLLAQSNTLSREIAGLDNRLLGSIQLQQRLLEMKYLEMIGQGTPLPPMASTEFKVYSQGGEDGIIHFLFSVVGIEHRQFLEIGFGDGRECNSANLSTNCFWNGWMIEGHAESVSSAKQYFLEHPSTWLRNIRVLNSWVTKDNVNELIRENGMTEKVDFFSLDIDGVDWWVWKEISGISPRVVVLEYCASFGPELSVTVPYEENFDRTKKHPSGFYYGASLRALVKLSKEKGYRFVGTCLNGCNAFFVRDDLAKDLLPEVSVEKGFTPLSYRDRRISPQEQLKIVSSLPLVTV